MTKHRNDPNRGPLGPELERLHKAMLDRKYSGEQLTIDKEVEMPHTKESGKPLVFNARPRYHPATTKSDWIEYSETLEAEVTRLLTTLESIAPFVVGHPALKERLAARDEERPE